MKPYARVSLAMGAALLGGFLLQFAGLWLAFRLDEGKAPAEQSVAPYLAPALFKFWVGGFHSEHLVSGLILGLGGDAFLYAGLLLAVAGLWRWLNS